ncbi:MAG: hypothetical protein NVSMB17_14530 [Candidatus Dormibacteria bacterium]
MATGQHKGKLTTLAVVLLLAVGFVAVSWYDTYNYEKRVPLGSWSGTFTTPTGQHAALLLVLVRKDVSHSTGGYSTGGPLHFPGTAKLCVAGAGSRDFAVAGATDVNGPGFTLSFVPTPSFEGAGFTEVRGIKQRDDLSITGHLATFHQGGGSTSVTAPDVTFALTKGDDRRDREACAASGG